MREVDLRRALLPPAIYEALQRVMRSRLVENYVGGDRMLMAQPRLGRRYLTVLSIDVAGHTAPSARRMLQQCVNHMLLEEIPRHRPGAVREFVPVEWLYDNLLAEGLEYWKSQGFVVGKMTRNETP